MEVVMTHNHKRRTLWTFAITSLALFMVTLGPLVGGAVVQGISWHWIFWINVPIGLALVPLSRRYLAESRGPSGRLDLAGLGLASAGLFAIVWGLVRGNAVGWGSAQIVG